MNTPYHYAVALAEEMKEKPVLYGKKHPISGELYDANSLPSKSACIPLYPIEALYKAYEQGKREAIKELTDEEIQEVYSKQHEISPNILAFAKAILRKAQEK